MKKIVTFFIKFHRKNDFHPSSNLHFLDVIFFNYLISMSSDYYSDRSISFHDYFI